MFFPYLAVFRDLITEMSLPIFEKRFNDPFAGCNLGFSGFQNCL